MYNHKYASIVTKYERKYKKNGYNTTNYVTLDTLFNTKI